MKKKILSGVLLLLIVTLVTGCGVKDIINKVTGKNEAVEAMKKLSYETDLDEANDIIGFDGKKEDNYIYVWEFKDGLKITGEVGHTSGKSEFTLTYEKEDFKNKKVDLSEIDDIKKETKSGTSFTYDEFKDRIGGQEGIITQVNKYGTHYVWVDGNGGYISAYFSRTTGKLVSYSGKLAK